MAVKLDGYVTVADRIQLFYEKYPEGCLQSLSAELIETKSGDFIYVRAAALRHKDDRVPGIGSAWEPVPGRTNFTRQSEVMNAETSAFGRAIAALGFEVKEGVASREEMEAAQARAPRTATGPKPAFVDPLYAKIKSAKDLKLLNVDQLKVQLVACGIGDPKGSKADLKLLSSSQAAKLGDWVDSQVKLAA